MRTKFLFTLLLVLVTATTISAKTTYIPKYNTKVEVLQNGQSTTYTGTASDTYLNLNDDSLFISVIHETVDKDKVKSIKRAKAAAGWAAFAAGVSAVAAGVNPVHNFQQLQVFHASLDAMVASTAASVVSGAVANALEHLRISLLIENNTEREVCVNDMVRGLNWYVPSKAFLTIEINNPEDMKLRVAYSYPSEPEINYLTIHADNTLTKWNVDFENDEYWLARTETNEYSNSITAIVFCKIDKNEFTYEKIGQEEYYALLKEEKKKAKAE